MSTAPYHPVVFGPFKSRRVGQSLGINPTPNQREACPKGCIYCSGAESEKGPIIDRVSQAPSAGVIVTSAARRIISMSKGGEKLACITVSGNNEPTKHPKLLEITENLRDLRNKWFPKAKLCLMADIPHLDTPDLSHAIEIYDFPVLRFEWGSAKTFTAFTGRAGTELKKLVEFYSNLERFVIQAQFVQGGPENSSEKEITAWVRKIEEMGPDSVQVLTLPKGARGNSNPKLAKAKPVTDAKLKSIAALVTEKTKIPAIAYSATGKLS